VIAVLSLQEITAHHPSEDNAVHLDAFVFGFGIRVRGSANCVVIVLGGLGAPLVLDEEVVVLWGDEGHFALGERNLIHFSVGHG
tara:strand:+ start:1445 stop:1696 length:252 start_codon:yes stop_codon:yes gene_type:complete